MQIAQQLHVSADAAGTTDEVVGLIRDALQNENTSRTETRYGGSGLKFADLQQYRQRWLEMPRRTFVRE